MSSNGLTDVPSFGGQRKASFSEDSLEAAEARASGVGMPSPSVLDLLRGISDRLEGFGARLDSFERGGRQDRRSATDGAAPARQSVPRSRERFDAPADEGGSDDASALGADYGDNRVVARREGDALLAHVGEVARALHWLEWNDGHLVLLRVLESGVPVPIPDEEAVAERAAALRRGAAQALRGLQRELKSADLRAVALASLFVEPFAVLRDNELVETFSEDMGTLLAWLYAEHNVFVRCSPGWASLTERETFARASAHTRAPPTQWVRKQADATLDLQVCSAYFNTKIPKALLDSQKLLRAIAVGAENALEVASGAGGEGPTWGLVAALHEIAALAMGGTVYNAESLLAQVTGSTASEFKVDQRLKVDKALTARERAEADAKAALKAQSDATAANEKIAAALVARSTPSAKWGTGTKGTSTPAASETAGAHAHAQSSAPSKRFQKRNAGASKEGATASAPAHKAADKKEKSPDASEGGGPQ